MTDDKVSQMRIQVLSDLHLEFGFYRVKVSEDADALVMAGDFTVAKYLGDLGAFARFVRKPLFFVAGNHDYYYGVFEEVNRKLEKMDSDIINFHFLNNKYVEVGEVKFIGSTLWSDFDLAPNPAEFASLVRSRINDFHIISKSSNRKFSPQDCQELNVESCLFLRREIDAPFNGKRVVVTHFLPSPKSIHSRFEGDFLNPYFCCNCEELMGPSVRLWIHGHTHESINYACKQTRVIANPKGYLEENERFNQKLVVEI